MIHKRDIVYIKPEFMDEGDEKFTWIAIDDEEKGRVTISPLNLGLSIIPRQVVDVFMLNIKK